MTKNDIKTAKAALESGTYELSSVSAGRGALLAKFCAIGKPGEALVRNGWSEPGFCLALATYAAMALAKGYEANQLAADFAGIGACNSSAARQAADKLTFSAEGMAEKPTLGDVWQACLGAGRSVLAPGLGALD